MMAHAFKQEQADRLVLELHGETIQDLYVEAARAVAELIGTATDEPPGPWVHEITDSTDLKDLLAAWINDVLERIEIDRILYDEVEIDELTDTLIRARMRGRPMKEKKTAVREAIIHGLVMTAGAKGCSATVTLMLQS
jgi:SHS2 domain-containing protein